MEGIQGKKTRKEKLGRSEERKRKKKMIKITQPMCRYGNQAEINIPRSHMV